MPDSKPTSSPPPRGIWAPGCPSLPKNLLGGRLFYGWAIVVGCTFGILFSIPGQTMGFSVFSEILMEKLGLTRVQLSTAYFVGTVASGFTLPALGRLYDFWGGRKMSVIAALATGLILFYLAATPWLTGKLAAIFPGTLTAFVVIGVGFYLIRLAAQGVLTMSSRNLVGKWFDANRGLAFAISGVIVAFGFAVAPIFLNALIEKFGASGTWIFLGCVTIFFMAPLAWFLFRDAPEDCGLEIDNGKKKQVREENPDMKIHRDFTRAEALRTFSLWIFALSFAFFSLFSTAYTFHVIDLGAEFGFEKAAMLALFVPMAVISVAVGFFCGWVNPKTRLKWLLAAMNFGALLAAIGLWRLGKPGGVFLYVLGNGICGGFFTTLAGIVWPRFYGRKWLGSISGVNMSAMVIASGLGPIFFALSKSVTDSYGVALTACVVIPAALFIGSFWADNPQREEK